MPHDNTSPLYGVDLWGPRGAWEREVEREESDRRWADLEEQTRSLGPQKCGSGRKIVTYYRTIICEKCGGDGIYREHSVGRSWPLVNRPADGRPEQRYRRVVIGLCRSCEGEGRVEVLANEATGERKVIQCLCCGKQLEEGEECR